ncbi:MAG: hypothetical protein GX843_04220 [Synergistaceae bacterium]|nr:hypothetical protein [Synergistaceae bacterium]
MFWNVLDESRQYLLRRLADNPPMKGAYLAGGTALARDAQGDGLEPPEGVLPVHPDKARQRSVLRTYPD